MHQQPLDVEGQVKQYQDYWRLAKNPDPNSNPNCPSGTIITLILNKNSPDPQISGVHMGKCCTDGTVWPTTSTEGGIVLIQRYLLFGTKGTATTHAPSNDEPQSLRTSAADGPSLAARFRSPLIPAAEHKRWANVWEVSAK